MENIKPVDLFNQALKPSPSFFKINYEAYPTIIWKNKHQTICSPKINVTTSIRRLTKASKLTFVDKEEYISTFVFSKKRMEYHTYRFKNEYINGIQKLSHQLVNIIIYKNGKEYLAAHQTGNGNYDWGKKAICTSFNNPIPIWLPTQKSAQQYERLKYVDLDKININWQKFSYKNYYYQFQSSYFQFLNLIKYADKIEFLQKINAEKLILDIINGKADMRKLTQKYLQKHKWYLKNLNLTFNQLINLDKINQYKGKVQPVFIHNHFIEILEKLELMKGFKLQKLQHYYLKHDLGNNPALREQYVEYLELLNKLYPNMYPTCFREFNKTLFPKDIAKEHNRLYLEKKKQEMVNYQLKMKKYQKEIQQRYQEDKEKYEQQLGNYLFVLPQTPDDFKRESLLMHNCVSQEQYLEKHSKRKTTIIFIRKANQPNTPYCTMEIQENKIKQLYAFKNNTPNKEVQKIAEEWCMSL